MTINKKRPAVLGNPKLKTPYSNSAASQRARILKHLENGKALSTMQAREQLGIMSPAPRVKELREQGYQIDTYRITEHDSNGVPHHRMGLYVLHSKREVQHVAD